MGEPETITTSLHGDEVLVLLKFINEVFIDK
jgi:hypothetical protein